MRPNLWRIVWSEWIHLGILSIDYMALFQNLLQSVFVLFLSEPIRFMLSMMEDRMRCAMADEDKWMGTSGDAVSDIYFS